MLERNYDMDNPIRIRYITRNFDALQGLKMVPFGLYFLAMGAGWLGEQGDLSLSLPAFLLALLAYWLLGRYYARNFGRVEPEKGQVVFNFLLPLMILLLLWVASFVDYAMRLTVSFFGLTLALVLFAWWWLQEPRNRIHYAVMAGLVALISLAPLGGIGQGWSIIQPPGNLFHLLVGAILAVGGILDHLVLIKSFPQGRTA